jgi:hypothetical protein
MWTFWGEQSEPKKTIKEEKLKEKLTGIHAYMYTYIHTYHCCMEFELELYHLLHFLWLLLQ